MGKTQAKPQSTTLEELAESYREVARLQKKAVEAQRDAAQAAARTRDMILQFCVEAGVTVDLGDDSDNRA